MPVTNALLEDIKASQEFADYRDLVEQVLLDQWEDLILSGVVNRMHNNFAEAITKYQEKLKEKGKKVKKAEQHASRTEINKLLLQGRIASMKKLERYVHDKVTGELRQVGNYSGYGMSTKTYLYSVMNKGGQAELNRYLGVDKIKFNLTSNYYKDVITTRAHTLIKGLDDHTANAFAKQLIKGMEAGDSKKQLVARLQSVGEGLSKSRANRIVKTETAAAVEYMRYETAKLNGVSEKIWLTTESERVCAVCGPLHEKKVKLEENFPAVDIGHPPVHTNCECYCDYFYDNLCSDYVDKGVQKKGEYKFYDEGQEGSKCVNPKAVWAGGSGLVGEDGDVGTYYQGLSDEGKDAFKDAWKNTSWSTLDDMANSVQQLVDQTGNKKLFTDVAELKRTMNANQLGLPAKQFMEFTSASKSKLMLAQARANLSDEGFVQLARQMGIRAKIPARVLSETIPEVVQEFRKYSYSTSQSKIKVAEFDLEKNSWVSIENKKNLLENKFSNVLTNDEYLAVHSYTYDTFGIVNGNLRKGIQSEKWEAYTKMLDSVLEKLPKENTVVYRGLTFPSQGKISESMFKVGSEFTDKAYMSTSLSRGTAKSFTLPGKDTVILEISTESGRKISQFSGMRTEEEILIPRNTKFKVTEIVPSTDGLYPTIVKMTEIVTKTAQEDFLEVLSEDEEEWVNHLRTYNS